MHQDLSLQNIKFILLFTGCIFLGMSLGVALTVTVTFMMQNAIHWYTSMVNLAINHLSIYLIPSLAYCYWFESIKCKDINMRSISAVSALWAGILALVLLLPCMEILIEWNKGIMLPQIFSEIERWIILKEQANSLLISKLMVIKYVDQLVIVLIVSALIASVGEELFFRGIIQNKLIKGTKNYHIGIWFAAALFSAVHLQFYGFFPRLVLGALFGYLYVWSGNLWVAILAHFINNSLFIMTSFFEYQIVRYNSRINIPIDPWVLKCCFFVLSVLFLLFFYRKNQEFLSKSYQ